MSRGVGVLFGAQAFKVGRRKCNRQLARIAPGDRNNLTRSAYTQNTTSSGVNDTVQTVTGIFDSPIINQRRRRQAPLLNRSSRNNIPVLSIQIAIGFRRLYRIKPLFSFIFKPKRLCNSPIGTIKLKGSSAIHAAARHIKYATIRSHYNSRLRIDCLSLRNFSGRIQTESLCSGTVIVINLDIRSICSGASGKVQDKASPNRRANLERAVTAIDKDPFLSPRAIGRVLLNIGTCFFAAGRNI